MLIRLSDKDYRFPRAEFALREPNGLLAVGCDFHSERLLNAYRNGIFPWFTEQDPPLWWSPDPRAVFTPASLHCSRSMQRFRRKTHLRVTLNRDFAAVIQACATLHGERDATWITADMQQAYCDLHQSGHAHSVEVWQGDHLVGGMYGVAQNRMFCGESMFHRVTNASKLALLSFAEAFFDAGGQLLDAQVPNPHLESLGMQEIQRAQFLHLLREDQRTNAQIATEFWRCRELPHI